MKKEFNFIMVLCAMFVLAACSGESASTQSTPQEEEHKHHHEAPHGGALIELGDHIGNLELVLGEDGLLTAYVLDAHAENPVRIKQMTIEIELRKDGATEKVSLDAVGNPLTGETPGDTSEFAATVEGVNSSSDFEAEIKTLDFQGITFKDILFSYTSEKE